LKKGKGKCRGGGGWIGKDNRERERKRERRRERGREKGGWLQKKARNKKAFSNESIIFIPPSPNTFIWSFEWRGGGGSFFLVKKVIL